MTDGKSGEPSGGAAGWMAAGTGARRVDGCASSCSAPSPAGVIY